MDTWINKTKSTVATISNKEKSGISSFTNKIKSLSFETWNSILTTWNSETATWDTTYGLPSWTNAVKH